MTDSGRKLTRNDLDLELAKLLTTLQVPMSIGVLGAARDPLVEIRRILKINGWHTAEEAEKAIKAVKP